MKIDTKINSLSVGLEQQSCLFVSLSASAMDLFVNRIEVRINLSNFKLISYHHRLETKKQRNVFTRKSFD
jgi:hypothetical protein